MKTFRLIAAGLIFAAVFAVSAFAQAQTATPKIGFIDTSAFGDEKAGITKYNNAVNALGNEIKPMYASVQKMVDDYQKLGTEITKMQEQIKAQPNGPISEKAITDKIEQYQQLEVRIKRDKEDADAKSEKRKQERLGPIELEIGKAIQEFAMSKGYGVILDAAKLDRAGIILAWDDKSDITAEFVKYFNAKPATGGTTATK